MANQLFKTHRPDGKWKVPAWMRPYLRHVSGATGNEEMVLDLYNDHHTSTFENAPRALACVAAKSEIDLLRRLHAAGVLKEAHDL